MNFETDELVTEEELENPDDIKILLVDDNESFHDLCSSYLEKMTVRAVASPERALEVLREDEEIECVVSDYQMPEMDGVDFLTEVRKNHPDLPFIMFTSMGSEKVASEAISAGVTDYLQKNGSKENYKLLRNKVKSAVHRKRLEERKRQMEEKLRKTKNRYKHLVEQNISCTYIVQDGEIKYANPKCEEIFGYTQEQLLEMTTFDLIIEEQHEKLEEEIRKREKGKKEDSNIVLTGVTKEGEEFGLEAHAGKTSFKGEPAIIGSMVKRTEESR